MRDKLQWRFGLLGLLGFFSGLPLALTAGTLSAWLKDSHVDRTSIGLFAAIATPYALKFLWSPVLDGARLPIFTQRFGRRRGWLLVSQLLLVAAIMLMGFTDPCVNPWLTALAGVTVATLSATQDTVIDAYRVELLPKEEQGTGAAWATFGYYAGMLVSGAGALALADLYGWQLTYLAMASIMACGVLLTLTMREPAIERTVQQGTRDLSLFLRDYVVAPFKDFMTRPLWLPVLLFVLLYKFADAFMAPMNNPFLLDIGFTKLQIAEISKLYGLIALILGTFAGGWITRRLGMFRALLMGGVLHMLTNLMLVVLAQHGAQVHLLMASVSLQNFTAGMSTAAFIAYLSALTRTNYTATQYALLSSLAAVGRTVLSTPSGKLADLVGWTHFFLIASLLALPGLSLLLWIERAKRRA